MSDDVDVAGTSGIDSEEEDIRAFLDELLQARRLSRYETDLRVGLAKGETSRILRAKRRLTYRQVLAIAAAAGLEPEELYRQLLRRRVEAREAREMLEEVKGPKEPPAVQGPSVGALDVRELETIIERVVDRALERRGR